MGRSEPTGLLLMTKKPVERMVRLTPPQFAMLERICKTNGGVVCAGFNEAERETKLIRKLESYGFVQGKAGNAGRAVHTTEGLAFYRAALIKTEAVE